MAVIGLWHFSFTVSDLDDAIKFYVDLLGCEFVKAQEQDNDYTRRLVGYPDAHLRVAQIRFPAPLGVSGHHLELVQYLKPRKDRRETEIASPGAPHLAFIVDDLDAEYARLTAAGVRFFSLPNEITEGANKGGKTVYFRGPDEIVHELVQPPRHLLEGLR